MPHTVVVIPCYNEARRLQPNAIERFLSGWPAVDLLMIDDGSTDETGLLLGQLAQRFPDRIATHVLACNRGKAEAVRLGMLEAIKREPRYVGYWDADLATPLEAIPRFCQVLDAHPQLQLVMGSRVAMLGRDIQRRFTRHLLGRCFATVVSWMLGVPVYDTQCGAKLFRCNRVLAEILQEPFCSRWIFDVELLARLRRFAPLEQAVHEWPLERWHDVRGSKLRPKDFARAAVELAIIYRRYLWTRTPAEIEPVPLEPSAAAAAGDSDASIATPSDYQERHAA